MISHKHQFIFIHIPRTAGTSIENAFYDDSCQLLPNEWDHALVPHTPLNHLTLRELVAYNILTPAQLRSYFKFCFVRNPWDRLISEISCRWMAPWFRKLSTEERIHRACELALTPTGIANHFRPQRAFIEADGLQMDFVGRFENLAEEFKHLAWALGVNVELPHHDVSTHRPYQEYYNAEMQALATAAYQQDITAFGYEFAEAVQALA